jgi:hypothetical protein
MSWAATIPFLDIYMQLGAEVVEDFVNYNQPRLCVSGVQLVTADVT